MINSIEFITASHNREILEANLLASKHDWLGQLTVKMDYKNIPQAYNSVKPINPYVCYLHHDVFLPKGFDTSLISNLDFLKMNTQFQDLNWGVIGVAGVKFHNGQKLNIGNIMDRGSRWGVAPTIPCEVDTLDEMLLITKGDFIFDENLPFDFYGADICMQAREQGRKCYAINAFCHHNSTRKIGERTPAFYEAEGYFKNKWKKYLPIATTCAIVQ